MGLGKLELVMDYDNKNTLDSINGYGILRHRVGYDTIDRKLIPSVESGNV